MGQLNETWKWGNFFLILVNDNICKAGWNWGQFSHSTLSHSEACFLKGQLLECHSEWVSVGRSVTETLMSFRWDEKREDETQTKELAPCSDRGEKTFTPCSDSLMSKKVFVTFSLSVALLSLFAAIEASLDWFWESSSMMFTVQICCSFNLVTVKSKKIIVSSFFFFFLLFTSTVFIISLYKSWFSTNENPCSKSHHGKPIIIPFKKILACDWMLIPYPCMCFYWTTLFTHVNWGVWVE